MQLIFSILWAYVINWNLISSIEWTILWIEARRRSGWQRMKWLDDSMGMSKSKLRELVKDREAWSAAVLGVTKSWTRLNDWTTTAIEWTTHWGICHCIQFNSRSIYGRPGTIRYCPGVCTSVLLNPHLLILIPLKAVPLWSLLWKRWLERLPGGPKFLALISDKAEHLLNPLLADSRALDYSRSAPPCPEHTGM